MRYEYYKLHAFVAGGLLSITGAMQGLGLIDRDVATVLAVPLIAYLFVSIIMTYRTFKESKVAVPATAHDYATLGKISKEQAKAEKKKAKALKKLAKKKSDQ